MDKPISKIVIPIISISWHGGVRVLIEIANYLAGLGYEVVFLVSRNRCMTPYDLCNGVRIQHVGIHTRVKFLDYFVFLCCVPFCGGKNAIFIANFFVTYYPVRLIALLRRNPYIYFVQDIESKYPLPRGLLLNALCRATYRDQNIVTANPHLHDRLLADFGTESRQISIGPSDRFFDTPVNHDKKYDVLYFLREESWKGLDRFKRFMMLSGGAISCLCVSQNTSLMNEIAGTGADFYKPVNDVDLIRCIDQARLVLLTSYREGFALPPLEGMARGLPTVLFPCGGPDVYAVDGRNSVYVNSEEAAVSAVTRLTANSVEYCEMSRQARVSATGFRMRNALVDFSKLVAARCS